ncbi:DUF1446 domain-containing protein [bacterium]|nr:DUF1446 domain-containing protein [bacterium]
MKSVIKIGNAQGFWGDIVDAPQRLVESVPDLDYLTLDYLAEVSLSIMAVQRQTDPSLGYARDFLSVLASLTPHLRAGRPLRVITNAGGLNPRGCAAACMKVLREQGCGHIKVALVAGDDVLQQMMHAGSEQTHWSNAETGESVLTIRDRLTTAHAYMGASPLVEALRQGADIVLTGRVADPSLVVAAAMNAFRWSHAEIDRIAQATIAGHLIECGTQVTGGIATDWLEIVDPVELGFPIIEIEDSGSFVVTKPPGSGGKLDLLTVKEQFLYEMNASDTYLSPDVSVYLDDIEFHQEAPSRVRVIGARGLPAPATCKVSATYRDGYTASAMLTIVGQDAVRKARRAGEVVFERVKRAGFELARTNIECLGTGDSVLGLVSTPVSTSMLEVVLRLSAADPRREAIDRFTKEVAPLVTGGPPGTTGYASGRAKVRPVFGYWPCLIPSGDVRPVVELMEVTSS